MTFIAVSCSQPNSQSLLSKSSTTYCESDPTIAGCSTSGTGSTDTTGALEIFTGQTSLTAAINNSDTVEISGTCYDQGKYNNRIIVQVFADEDEAQTPYINNEVSLYCQSSSNPVQSGLESNTSDQCIYVTSGLGVQEVVSSQQTLYPQCFNGQYSFSVRLGKVLADSGKPYKKYLVRFKLRAIEPSPALPTDSEWMRVTVDRPLEKPSMGLTPMQASGDSFACLVNGKASRTNLNIYYSLTRSFTDPTTSTVQGPTAVYTNKNALDVSNLFSVFNYKDILPEGQTYTYQLTSTEGQYAYTAGNTPTEVSQSLTCKLDPPVLQATGTSTSSECYFGVVTPNIGPNIYYEYGYRQDSVGWTTTNPNGQMIPATCAAGSSVCTMSGLASGSYYYVAVRARDNTQSIIGNWSNVVTCRTQ